MESKKRLKLPLDASDLAQLVAGDEVLISGPVYTMRDAGHVRCLEALEKSGALPFDLKGQTLFYAGPTPELGSKPFGAIGPTTASRMDFATPTLMRAGIVATIGKGKRSQEVIDACVETGGVYFSAVGGIAAKLAECVKSSELIAWEDLGTEALRRIIVEDLPVFVEVDSKGNDLYRMVESKSNQ